MPIARGWVAGSMLPAKSVTVWRKGPDGAWKCVVDAWSDDAPPAPKL